MNTSMKMALLAGAFCLAAAPAFAADAPKAAAPKASARAFVVKKNADGTPNLNGVWTNATVTPLVRDKKYGARLIMTPAELKVVEDGEKDYVAEGNLPTDPNATVNDLAVNCGRGFSGTNCGYNRGWTDPGTTVMRVNGEPRTSFLTTPDGQVPATKPGARPATAGRPALPVDSKGVRFRGDDNPETKSLAERCLTSFGASAGPVMQPLLYNNNYQIQQSKDAVVIEIEMVHDARIIRLNDKHRTDGVRPWWGDSIGHYDGNTLVVETTNFHPRNSFRGSSENLTLIEKFTPAKDDRLLYQFTVIDPTLWDKPFGGEYEFGRTPGLLYEYACHEGNYALEGMLAGAREEDRKAAEAAANKPQAAR